MRVAFKCLVLLTGLALAVSILLSSNHIAPNFPTSAIQRSFAQPFDYPGSVSAHIHGNPNLLFDPVLVYSTLLGGDPQTYPNVSFADASGNVYVAGYEYGTVK